MSLPNQSLLVEFEWLQSKRDIVQEHLAASRWHDAITCSDDALRRVKARVELGAHESGLLLGLARALVGAGRKVEARITRTLAMMAIRRERERQIEREWWEC